MEVVATEKENKVEVAPEVPKDENKMLDDLLDDLMKDEGDYWWINLHNIIFKNVKKKQQLWVRKACAWLHC